MNGSVRPIADVFDVPTGAGHDTRVVSEQSCTISDPDTARSQPAAPGTR